MATIGFALHSFLLCGGVRIALEWCNRLAGRGHRVLISTHMEPRDLSWFELHEGCTVVAKEAIVKASQDALVVSFFDTLSGIDLSAVPARVPCFLVVQGNDRAMHPQHVPQIEAAYRNPRLRPLVIAGWLRDSLRSEFGRDDVVYIPNHHETPPGIHPYPQPAGRPMVLVEGHTAPAKGVADAWNAINGLPCTPWLLTNATMADVDAQPWSFERVFCQRPWREALSLIASADIFIKPSHMEGSPTPHLEAMALGTALVTSNCSGTDEWCVPGHNCHMYPVGDVGSLRKCVASLLTDVPQRKALAARGQAFARRHFDWTPSIDRLESTLLKEGTR